MALPVLRPMSQPEYEAWQALAIPAYADDKVASGQWTRDEALARSTQEHEELLPKGLDTPDNHLFTIQDAAAAAVGVLWFAVQPRSGTRIAYVFDIEVWPAHRRQGHARAAFAALEQEVQRLGLAGIALHVFGHNHPARALYETLGFEPTNLSLFKAVAPAMADRPAAPRPPPPEPPRLLLRRFETVLLFVPDIEAAAAWYAELLGVAVEHENPQYAFVRGPRGVLIGFHPADGKCPGGIGGTTVVWDVTDLAEALQQLLSRGAVLHRGPMTTSLGAQVAMVVDPFGNTLGLNQPRPADPLTPS